jgi:hypothetical protein
MYVRKKRFTRKPYQIKCGTENTWAKMPVGCIAKILSQTVKRKKKFWASNSNENPKS